jgi:hypothetical protein
MSLSLSSMLTQSDHEAGSGTWRWIFYDERSSSQRKGRGSKSVCCEELHYSPLTLPHSVGFETHQG